jgi:hypothetical protein
MASVPRFRCVQVALPVLVDGPADRCSVQRATEGARWIAARQATLSQSYPRQMLRYVARTSIPIAVGARQGRHYVPLARSVGLCRHRHTCWRLMALADTIRPAMPRQHLH